MVYQTVPILIVSLETGRFCTNEKGQIQYLKGEIACLNPQGNKKKICFAQN